MGLYEISGKLDIDTGFLPIDIYGQYVTNASAKEGENTALFAGFGAKHGPFKMDYNYRDTQKHAVASTFNESDFATGHKVKLSYKISKNFSTGVTYFAAEEYNSTNIDSFQWDLKAKF